MKTILLALVLFLASAVNAGTTVMVPGGGGGGGGATVLDPAPYGIIMSDGTTGGLQTTSCTISETPGPIFTGIDCPAPTSSPTGIKVKETGGSGTNYVLIAAPPALNANRTITADVDGRFNAFEHQSIACFTLGVWGDLVQANNIGFTHCQAPAYGTFVVDGVSCSNYAPVLSFTTDRDYYKFAAAGGAPLESVLNATQAIAAGATVTLDLTGFTLPMELQANGRFSVDWSNGGVGTATLITYPITCTMHGRAGI